LVLPSADPIGQAQPLLRHEELPVRLQPMWWNAAVRQSVGTASATMPITLDQLVQSALAHSVQIRSLLTEPEIRRAVICVEQSAFDWTSFIDSRFDDTSDPIGNIL